MLNAKMLLAAAAAVLGLAVAGWAYRGSAPAADALRAVGLPAASPTPQDLRSAGVHKCAGPAGTSYVDGPCPAGSREVAAQGGTLTVMTFDKPAPMAARASAPFGGPIVKPMDPAERDRLRDKQIEDAANRP